MLMVDLPLIILLLYLSLMTVFERVDQGTMLFTTNCHR